jgi:hypothetical protein
MAASTAACIDPLVALTKHMDRFAFNFILFFYNDEDVDPALHCLSARLGKTLGMRRKFCARSRCRQGRGIRLERILQLVARATRDKEQHL